MTSLLRGRPSATRSTASRSPTSAPRAASSSARCLRPRRCRWSTPSASPHPATCGCPARRSAAPVVSGAAAQMLAKNPNWTPDKVKGALMLTARPTAAGMALGVGEVNAKGASFDYADLSGGTSPNPNLGLSALRRPGRHRRPGLRLGQLGEHGHGERLLEPGELERAPPGRTQAGRRLRGTRPAGRTPPGPRRAGPRPPGTLPAGQPLPGPRRAGTRPAGQPLPGPRRRQHAPQGADPPKE